MAMNFKYSDETLVTTLGRNPEAHDGSINPPVERVSTRVFPNLEAYEAALTTGRLNDFIGSKSVRWLESAVAALEGPESHVIASQSGMASLTLIFLTVLGPNDHLLLPDTVFHPTRAIADGLLQRMGISTTFYDPLIGHGIGALIQPNTKLILVESPGSATFEVQDIPAITGVAHAAGVLVAMDNSWATPLNFRPLEHGVDFSMCAITKYLVGHSDIIMGTVATSSEYIDRLHQTSNQLGYNCSSDDVYLALRGLRTMALRLRQHEKSALRIAEWLQQRKEVRRVLHPAFPTCPGHEYWQRDFSGSSGLFSVVFDPLPRSSLVRFLESLQLFRIGVSWGGFESLVLPMYPEKIRTAVPWTEEGSVIRINIGLESPDDLESDLERALAQLPDNGRQG
jgi:cystathionine beta-lyase